MLPTSLTKRLALLQLRPDLLPISLTKRLVLLQLRLLLLQTFLMRFQLVRLLILFSKGTLMTRLLALWELNLVLIPE